MVNENKHLPIQQLFDHLKHKLKLDLVTGETGLLRFIKMPEINRPGLAIAGYFDDFSFDRIQLMGITETNYFKTLSKERQKNIMKRFFSYEVPCVIFTTAETELKIPTVFVDFCRKFHVPLFSTPLPTSHFHGQLYHHLEEFFAPEITMHGVLVDIFGVGTLITGEGGVGKSECALQLVERGHRLVADDIIFIKKYSPDILVGKCSNLVKHNMEIRGIGVFDVTQIFGFGRVRYQKKISLVVHLIEQRHISVARTGLEQEKEMILGVEVDRKIIPVKPGRNMALLIEVAALVFRQTQMGMSSAESLNEQLINAMKKNTKPGSIDNGW